MALVLILMEMKNRVRFDLALAHVHHGVSSDTQLNQGRDAASEAVKKLAAQFDLPIFISTGDRVSGGELLSEQALREHRHRELMNFKNENGFDFLVLAHHADDLFETRLIRLIRGTGCQGLIAMKKMDPPILRPLLGELKSTLRDYLEQTNFIWIEDPSNSSADPLRNWLRLEWLPQLEKKHRGGSEALRHSLENLAEGCEVSLEASESCFLIEGDALSRPALLNSTPFVSRQAIAKYLLAHGVSDFTRTHIDEIRKRISNPRKKLTFSLLKRNWLVDAERVKLVP